LSGLKNVRTDVSSSCGGEDVSTARQYMSSPMAGVAAESFPPNCWNVGLRVDLTADLQGMKPQIPFSTASQFFHLEYESAVALLRPFIEDLPGGKYFYKMLIYTHVPAVWTQASQGWPPVHPKGGRIDQFGVRYHCDHFRTSGCPIKMVIMRDYAFDPDKDVYSICISKGHHRVACNHSPSYNCGGTHQYPALHPMIDMYLRLKVAAAPQGRHGYVLADIRVDLIDHLRHTTALHCEYKHAGIQYDRNKDHKLKICCHARNYEHYATLPGFEKCQVMPDLVDFPPRSGYSRVPYLQTRSHWTHVYHMSIHDGHTVNGNHRMDAFLERQIKARLSHWNQVFRSDSYISESTTRESGVGPLFACFADQNLFVRWNLMKTTDKSKWKNLDPFEWNFIGLLYRQRTTKEINDGLKRKKDDNGASPDPEPTDPKNLPYEFVAVYASLMSLMTSVKAWMCRKIIGRVEICADNMYNPIRGVPNMYWLNTGVIDAKQIHFPTVNALQLGRGHPRNQVTSLYPLHVVPCVLLM
jgi:hypothetical protein